VSIRTGGATRTGTRCNSFIHSFISEWKFAKSQDFLLLRNTVSFVKSKISLTSSHSFFHQFDYFLFLSCFSMDLIILFLPLIWVYLTYSICRSAHISLYASWAVISHMLFIPLQQINLFMFSFKHIIHWCLFSYSFSSFPPHFDYRSNTFHPWPYSTPNTRSLSSFLLVLTLLYIYSYLFVCIITWILRIRCPYSIHVIQPPAL